MSSKKLLIAADGNRGRKPKLEKKIASTRDSLILSMLLNPQRIRPEHKFCTLGSETIAEGEAEIF